MNKRKIDILIKRYLDGTSSHEENEWLEKWLDERENHSEWDWQNEKHKQETQKEIFNKIENKVVRVSPRRHKRRIHSYQRAIAALLIIGFTFGFWLIIRNKEGVEKVNSTRAVAPGTKAATLQMGNGEIIYLDDREEGLLRQLNEVEITKMAGGAIHYNTSGVSSSKVFKNTLFIPRGGQYQVILPDGTKVWMNSETTLIYPTRFVGKERKVKLVGEAYFEVAKNVDQPFIVESGGMEVLVTGTEFNISAYESAAETTTTLVAGSVEVYSKGKQNIIRLNPGQQAYQNKKTMNIQQRDVDVNTIVSWRKGYFSFEYQTLEEMMKEVSRWYDIDYEIIGKSTNIERLGGTFSREKSLDELLSYIEQLVDVKVSRKERSVVLMH